jgi:hypothetical protein
MNAPPPHRRAAPTAVGGRGDPADEELLIDGQEEVFSRTEVELGRIEHRAGEDAAVEADRAPTDDDRRRG